ncbi:MAG: GMC family oxidoreductase [Deltaproteobacteria bacterium]|nr:GMC family oxidoreductase [Deltaproteobacteria bacterium]
MPATPKTDLTDSADFVVVGAGAAGLVAARWLAAAGHAVLVLECGHAPVATPFESPELLRMLHGGGQWRTRGPDAISLQAGRAVGGSTAIGWGVHAALPEEVYARWVALDPAWQTRMPYAEVDLAHECTDAEFSVAKADRDLWGESGRMLMDALVGVADPVWRGAPGCKGTSRCAAGCPTKGMGSVDRVVWPIAVRHGARMHTGVDVQRIVVQGGRAVGVTGQSATGGRLAVTARRAVLLCAGTLGSLRILHRSRIPHTSLGMTLHVEALVAGLLADPVHDDRAAGLAVQARIPGVEDATLSAVSTLPRLRAMALPGAGLALEHRMELLANLVTWQVTVACEARGRVREGLLGPQFAFDPTARDRARVLAGVAVAADAMLDQGAVEVYPQAHGAPAVATTGEDVTAVARATPVPGVIPLFAHSFFGGLQVDERYAVPGVKGLVVADASVLPAPTVVPPLATVMAVAMAAVQRWA